MFQDLERAFGRWEAAGCPDLDEYSPDSERELVEIHLLHRTGLARFRMAQENGVWGTALGELEAGQKVGHWMWYIFPQMYGLGWSFRSRAYGIRSTFEARAYMLDPILGRRYCEAVIWVDRWLIRGATLEDIFGDLDALKYESSTRLFLPSAI